MNIELCNINYIDRRLSTSMCVITYNDDWYDADELFLYDNKSSSLFYSKGNASDASTAIIDIDLGSVHYIDTIKLLKTNIKSGSIQYRDTTSDAWTTISITGNTYSSLHYFLGNSAYLITESGVYLTTEDSSFLTTEGMRTARYIRINATTTQVANEEKHIGEIYIGQRLLKLETTTLSLVAHNYNDFKKQIVNGYDGYGRMARGNTVISPSVTLRWPSKTEYDIVKSLVNNGGCFTYFPTAGEILNEVDHDLSIDDIYLCQANGNLSRVSYGNSTDGFLTLDMMETKLVY